MDLPGKIALVTGGAARVGRAIALALAERGADVAITYRTSAEAARQTIAEMQALGRRALAVACDQRDAGEVAAAVAEVERHLGDVDV
ncbi:MAG: SDR family NAD(P)-dependent oxidoreductase, partial [Armatimonadetes bacterium]|nr:SDR family NAD(P)-dependent oxidoreductase [Armatimonadota bacterium]